MLLLEARVMGAGCGRVQQRGTTCELSRLLPSLAHGSRLNEAILGAGRCGGVTLRGGAAALGVQ